MITLFYYADGQRAEQQLSLMKLEIKKEVGWLIFLLIPFLFFLVVHFVVPLCYITQTIPLLQDNYNAEQILLRHHSIRSITQTNSRIANRKLIKYYEAFYNLEKRIEENSPGYQSSNLASVTLNNAYAFTQKMVNNGLGEGYREQLSMWFATNKTTFDELTPLQQQIYLMYAGIEPYIRSQLVPYQNKSFSSMDTYIQMDNQSMYFQFPSKYEAALSNLTNEGMFAQYQSALNNYNRSNRTINSFLKQNPNETIQLQLCTLLKNNDWGIYGITCMNLDLNLLGTEMTSAMSLFAAKFSTTNYYLVLPVYLGNAVNYLNVYQFGKNTTYVSPTNYIQRTFTLTTSNTIQVFRNGFNTYIFSPICLEDEDSNPQIVLYFMTTNEYLTTNISESDQFGVNLKLYLILVITFITISFIVSFCVLKSLMNGLDEQLIELQNRCNFICEGDVNIEIPDYDKTLDIRQVYDKVRVINKIHRYSSAEYFTGHHISKILKYTEAMEFFKTLNYDIGYVLQNLGEAYLLMEEYDKSIECLKESVKIVVAKIEADYDTLDSMMTKKKAGRVSMHYKEIELVLIRRAFCLVQSMYYIIMNWSKHHSETETTAMDRKTKEDHLRDVMDYISLLKKAFYPEYALFAESVVTHLFETAIYKDKGNIEAARECLNKSFKISDIYIENYAEIGKKLKEKGSKYKFFHLKNKITSVSRMHPEAVKAFRTFVKATVVAAEAKRPHFKDYQAITLLFETVKFNLVRDVLMFTTVSLIKKMLRYFQCDTRKLQTTQFYRQIIHFKGYEAQQTTAMRMIDKDTTIDKQFVYLVDCWKNSGKEEESAKYFQGRACQIYDRFVKPKDRVSIINFNTVSNIKIQCSLTLKQSKEEILLRTILAAFNEKGGSKLVYNQLFEVFERTIHRIKKLRSKKVVLIFFKKMTAYSEHMQYIRKKQKSRTRRHMNSFSGDSSLLPDPQNSHEQFNRFGEWIVQLIVQSGIFNCKVCLFTSEGDKPEEFIHYFGLEDINKRLWHQFAGVNRKNNMVYVLSASHKSDLDRILMSKIHENPDNHIFML